MPKLIFVRDTVNGKPVKQGLTEASPVGLPTKLVEIVLETSGAMS